MAVSDAKKKANAKWDSENMATLACKTKKEQAEKFKSYCTAIGKTTNAVLRDYVLGCIGEVVGEIPRENAAKTGDIKPTQSAAGAQDVEGATLTPETLKKAQEAAQNAGETVSAFVGRAVETQAQRDKLTLAMRPKEKVPDKPET